MTTQAPLILLVPSDRDVYVVKRSRKLAERLARELGGEVVELASIQPPQGLASAPEFTL